MVQPNYQNCLRLLRRIQQRIKKQTDRRRNSSSNNSIKPTSLFVVGEKVKDDLTRKEHTVIGISYKNGHCGDKKVSHYHCWGIWIDSDYAGGARHPWELTKIK